MARLEDGSATQGTSHEEELARLDQALLDLSACQGASVALLHCPSASREQAVARDLAARARERGFVTAELSLRAHGLQELGELVREVLGKLVPPEERRARGLLHLLDGFAAEHRAASGERFASAAGAHDAEGDLAALCRGYLAAEDTSSARRAFGAWVDGVEPPRKHRNPEVRRALSERTAQRALRDLSRIVRALGHRGTVILLSEGEALAARTERQREKGYTVLRELVDNFDAAGGAAAIRLIVTGQVALFEGPSSVRSVVPLRMRLEVPSAATPAPPHRPWTILLGQAEARRHRASRAPEAERAAGLRNLIRISEGVPPIDQITRMSVGQEKLDGTIRRLFASVKRSGSFFSVLVGEYGSGKTHLMMHLAERALEDERPVFWLNLERANLDLGNPARHLQRFLEHSQLPSRGRPSALAMADRWTRSSAGVRKLTARLEQLATEDGHAAQAARKAVRIASSSKDVGFALENFLSATDLADKPGDANYRLDAYRRIFLWFDLLAALEEIRGPVILIDEAENLYTSGRPPAARRTSLRSLSFYCGGALPGSCVVMAMTPPAFEEMKGEARDLLAEAGDLDTTLDVEQVERFRRSLWGLKPDPVKGMSRADRAALCERVRKMHQGVRGPVRLEDEAARLEELLAAHASPRTLVRALIDELESAWWRR